MKEKSGKRAEDEGLWGYFGEKRCLWTFSDTEIMRDCYFEQGMAGTEARLEFVEVGDRSEKWTLTVWTTLRRGGQQL